MRRLAEKRTIFSKTDYAVNKISPLAGGFRTFGLSFLAILLGLGLAVGTPGVGSTVYAEEIAAEAGQASDNTEVTKEDSDDKDNATEESSSEDKAATDQDESVENSKEESDSETYEHSDIKADIETEADWEKTLPKKMAHDKEDPREDDYRTDMVNIAKSQIGYQESDKNYVSFSEDEKAYYNRYGAWYTDRYAHPWDSEFACFVIEYAGVPDVPFNDDTEEWVSQLSKDEMYYDTDYKAEAGDLIFLEEEDGIFHVGVITRVKKDKLVYVAATVNRPRNKVKRFSIDKDSEIISAYAVVVPEDPEEVEDNNDTTNTDTSDTDTTNAEKDNQEVQAKEGSDISVTEEPSLKKARIQAKIYNNIALIEELDDVGITVEGELPEDADIIGYPVQESLDNEETYVAYQIIIYDKDGHEFHSTTDDGQSITVTIYDDNLTKILKTKKDVHGWNKEDDDVNDLSFKLLKDGGVQFKTSEF